MYVCKQMDTTDYLKGTLKTIILGLLDEKGSMYGYEITQTVKLRTEHEINLTEGALYPALHRLEQQDWVSSSKKTTNGRTRKYYELTPKGKKEAVKAKKAWGLFTQLVFKVIHSNNYAQ